MRTRQRICEQKARYASADDALQSARASGLDLRPYRCERCRRFHLTSRTKGKWVPKAADR
jgi:hypothetical protein